MRILHLSMLYPPHVMGGAERSVAALAEAQADAGYEVFACCTTPGPFTREERNRVTVFRMPHETRFWAEDWPKHNAVERLWRKAAMPFNRRLRRHFERVLDIVRPDIVHTHSMVDVSTSLWPLAARRGYPVVHTLRDYDLMCVDGSMYHGGEGCGPKCRILSLPKQRHVDSITAVVGISEDVLQRHLRRGLFRSLNPQRRRVIWNSARVQEIGPDYLRPDRTGKPFTYGYLGRITQEKGIDVLIDAMRRLPPDLNAELLVAGDAPTGLDKYIRDTGDLPIRFLGHCQPKEFFERIDLLIVPSLWAEPFGRIVLEAYSARVPVLASLTGGLPDLIAGDPGQWLVPSGDPTALASRMEAIARCGREKLPSPDMFASILARTIPEAIASEYLRFYEELIGHSGEGRLHD